MNARNGNWTIPQLLLDLEARVKALEENQLGYVHHITFTASTVEWIHIDIINDTNLPFTSDTLLEHLLALPENIKIMCTGNTSESVAITSLTKQGNQIMANLVDTDGRSFTTLTLVSDYPEPIKSWQY